MTKYIIALALSLSLANIASANEGGVVIKKAEKVLIQEGMSHKDKMKMIRCMVLLKEYPTAEDAMKAKMAKIDEKCKTNEMCEKKCHFIKKKAAKGIYNCYTMQKFFRNYFGAEMTK